MSHSRRDRHRDRAPGHRELDQPPAAADRVFRITDAHRQQVAKCLRYIDDARRALEGQQNPDNREIIRELRTSADRIFELMNDLEELSSDLDQRP